MLASFEEAPDCQSIWVKAIERDYEALGRKFGLLVKKLESMPPVITYKVQISQGRQAFLETTNLSRLTYLALVFVPLTFTCSLFSMGGDVGPGSSHFWVYFAVAIPLLLLTFSLTISYRVLSFVKQRSEEAL
jgi:Mg2+ and Co2+ transporter CorA